MSASMSAPASIPFNLPHLTGREAEVLGQALASRHLSGDGPFTRRAAGLLEAATGACRALLTTSCTHALEMSALLAGVGPGDEVIVPSFTFVSTATAFALRGARIVFADVRPDTLCLDVDDAARRVGPRTRAIVAVHYAGIPCDVDRLVGLAAAHDAMLVEDNAHGLFARWRGTPLGRFGAVATLSFHQTKNVSCGEGGALLVNDPALLERAEIIREKGTDRSRFLRGEIDKYTWVDDGSSWLPADLLAAVLVAQLEAGEAIQAARHRAWATYHRELAGWAARHGVVQPTIPDGAEHPAHMYWLVLPDGDVQGQLRRHLAERGVQATSHYQPLHSSTMGLRHGGVAGDCPVTERVAASLLRLPLYADLGDADVARVVDAVTAFVP